MVALRALEGAVADEGGRRVLHADVVARETRITLGQLPAELRDAVKRIRIFGPRELARQLADELELKFEPMGLQVEVVAGYAPGEFGVQVPPEVSPSAAFSLAARFLDGTKAGAGISAAEAQLHRAACREIFIRAGCARRARWRRARRP